MAQSNKAPPSVPGSHDLEMAATLEGAAAEQTLPAPDRVRVGFAAPRHVGRFLLLRLLGSGGMGAVYAAFDERLDRRVAIKLLHEDGSQSSLQRERVLREAQAMARISHANVVPIYEVGEVDDQIFIAMEFVEGITLKEWQRLKPRPWQDVLRMYLQAGEGLRAAHDAGLIHRDFKADNVLIGKDERPRVADFGLARLGAGRPLPSASEPASPSGERLATPLTVAGAISGTPGYMSPEQYLAQEVDARSDQWSFCAALYEALYGRLPFTGDSLAELSANTLAGKLSPQPANSQVPREVHQALTRGLSVDPSQRFSSMAALLAALALEQGHTAAALAATRRRAVNLFIVVILGLQLLVRFLSRSSGLTLSRSIRANIVMAVLFFSIGLLLRRTLLRNAFHRRIYIWCAVTLTQKIVLMFFEYYFALPYPVYLCLDFVVLAGACTLVSFLGLPVLFWVPPLLLVSAGITAHYGDAAVPYVGSLYTMTAAVIAIAWNSAAERAQREMLQTSPKNEAAWKSSELE